MSQHTALNVGVGFSREWTRADTQTSPNEVWLSDPSLGVSYQVFGDAGSTIRLNGASTAHVPLSPASRAASTIVRLDQSLTASGRVSGLALSYTLRGTKFFHEYTTGQLQSPRLGACKGVECFRFMHTGVRNTDWSNAHIVALSITPWSRMRLSALSGVGVSYLYPLTSVAGLPEDEGPAFRYATLTQVSAQIDITQGFSVRTGVENYYAQLQPDGSRQTFFLNRYANVFLDLVVSDALFTTAVKGTK